MSKQSFIIVLSPQTPPEFLKLFQEHIENWRDSPNLLSLSVEHVYPFVELLLVPSKEGGSPIKVYVPSSYVLAILDIGEGKLPLGFREGSQ